jgi:alkanesulfonate monooxygenase SsuD/methylene tetrahydromethanopterin reductase-like flavin-dependent oxidoreductase (luciferase family)
MLPEFRDKETRCSFGTPFMKTTEIVAVARMFDEAGYEGSDHLIYPRELSSPYPDSSTRKPGWPPETAWPDSWVLIGAMAAVTSRLRFSNGVYIAPARPLPSGGAERFREPIERFAETIIAKVRG